MAKERPERYAPPMKLAEQMDRIYRELSPESIPWNLEQPPALLVELVESGKIAPCDAVDLGCGAGNYAVWLATRGFRVTGIDLSPRAVELAAQRADQAGQPARFVVGDLTEGLPVSATAFDFAYDWEVLHHVFPEARESYLRNVRELLRPGGLYFSVCFSEHDPGFGGQGKVRETRLGTQLYFSSEDELNDALRPFFDVRELSTAEVAGKYGPHRAVVALAERR